jgi:hypothetical protein
MRRGNLLTEIGLGVLALALALLVIVPVFLTVHWLYDDGDGLIRVLFGTVFAWLLLVWLLRRRRVMF